MRPLRVMSQRSPDITIIVREVCRLALFASPFVVAGLLWGWIR